MASTLQWCKPKLPENTVTFTVTETFALAAIFVVACVIGYVTD